MVHTQIHTPTAEWTVQGDSQLVGRRQGEASRSGTPQLGTRLGGAADRTRNLPVMRQPARQTDRDNRLQEHSSARNVLRLVLVLYAFLNPVLSAVTVD